MLALIVLHADAGTPEGWAKTGKPDEFRSLTDEGKAKCRRSFAAIKPRIETLHAIATSPLTRAVETAELLARAFPGAGAATTPILKPDANPDEAIAWLARRSPEKTLALVGHKPHLNDLTARLCGLREDSVANLGPGACALVEFEGKPGPGRGKLLWVHHG